MGILSQFEKYILKILGVYDNSERVEVAKASRSDCRQWREE